DNPINWALAVILTYMLHYFTVPRKTFSIPAKHPEVLVFKNYTPLDLLPFNGENGARILMGVNGSVYDVSAGRNFYGPGSPYANFAGHDASRGLAKNSFDADMMADPKGAIDKLEDLEADEWESLREWENLFSGKYILAGKLVENTN
ncbi:cytochrome b5, partial [Backusella circina FSU 941]